MMSLTILSNEVSIANRDGWVMESAHEKGPFLCSCMLLRCHLILWSAFRTITRRRIKLWSKETVYMRDFKVLTAIMLKGCDAMLSLTNLPTSWKNLLSPGSNNSQGRHFPFVGAPRLVFLHLFCRLLKRKSWGYNCVSFWWA